MNIYYIEQLIKEVRSSRDTDDIISIVYEILEELHQLDNRVNSLEVNENS